MSASRRLGVKLTLSLSTLLLAVLAAEVAHRLWFYGPGGLSPVRLASVRDFGDTGFTRDSAHPRVEYELKPDLRGWFKLQPFETNSHGLRDREHAREKPGDTFRIAVIGDSFTMGSGVPIESVYHSLLEASLNESGTLNYECINFGVAGYGLLHYAGRIEHGVLDWDPDLILIGLVSNDRKPPALGYLHGIFPEHPGLAGLPERTVRREAPARGFLRLTLLEGLLGPAGRSDREQDDGREGGSEQGVRLELAIQAARSGLAGARKQARQRRPGTPGDFVAAAMARLGRLAGATPVFCVYLDMPLPPTVTAEETRERGKAVSRRAAATLESACLDAGLGFLDTSSLLDGLDPGQLAIFPDDNHPNARAHAVYAEALHDALKGGSWLE